jgi:hypothetical protein
MASAPPCGSETNVAFTDVIEAYESGDVETARDRARRHLAAFESELDAAESDLDREGALIQMLGTIRSVLQHEGKLMAPARLRPDTDLMRTVDAQLGKARGAYAGLAEGPESQKAFIQEEIGRCVADLVRMLDGVASPAEIEAVFSRFTAEALAAGYASPAAALAPPPAPAERKRTFGSVDQTRILFAVRDYYDGLAGDDVERLVSATGSSPAEAQALLARYRQNLGAAGIAGVASFTIPPPEGAEIELQISETDANDYYLSLRGIAVAVLRTDGARETQTWDELVRLRRHADGSWTVIPPK